ncbi:MAG TPA: hypothetical protein VFP86_05480 [bacterium]|nr:hypothetical protein [bacterium]
MRAKVHGQQHGAAVLLVLLIILVLVAVGTFVMLSVDRNSDMRVSYQKNVAGFNAAEAGLNVGAAQVLTTMQGFSLPTNCNPQSLSLNNRTVTYRLSVPGNAPGDCTPNVSSQSLVSGPYAGLNAIVHSYSLTSTAKNAQGYTEASLTNQFFANLIPVFQFASFYKNDLEILPSPPMVINGRVHTNGDLYLNSDSCGSAISAGLNILGKVTIVGSNPNTSGLFRGRKDSTQNWNNVYISLDGTPSNMQVLGTTQGSTSCAQVSRREVQSDEIQSWNGRITNKVSGITLPGVDSLLCTPWVAACNGTGGAYWQNANLRIVLDLTAPTEHLDPSAVPTGPKLPPIQVLDAGGSVNTAKTDALHAFMRDPAYFGAITYTDVPATGAGSHWDCKQWGDCENSTYKQFDKYPTPFPRAGDPNGCTVNRDPRNPIDTFLKYCYDYRFGGFYNWRERKPVQILNIDWIALDEYNRNHSNVFFDPNTTTNGGVVAFLSVKGPNSSGGNHYGVRILDAARLPREDTNTGVTFASDVAAYVAGNFNCPAMDTSGGDSVPAACGSAKRPSSVIADSINVLSCAWIDAAACANYTTGSDQWAGIAQPGVFRPVDERSTAGPANGMQAQQTAVNAAFLAGNDTTVGSWYSGGLENYPRFHEDWQTGGPYKFWYQGSFVSLDTPKHSCWAVLEAGVTDDAVPFRCTNYPAPNQGFWTDTRYVPPPRRWFYDVSFNNSTNLPPLTPRFVYLQLVYFTEVFH